MTSGTLVSFGDRGFGFIRPDDTADHIFIHISSIARDAHEKIQPGDRFNFEIIIGADGRRSAVKAWPISAATEEVDRVFGAR